MGKLGEHDLSSIEESQQQVLKEIKDLKLKLNNFFGVAIIVTVIIVGMLFFIYNHV